VVLVAALVEGVCSVEVVLLVLALLEGVVAADWSGVVAAVPVVLVADDALLEGVVAADWSVLATGGVAFGLLAASVELVEPEAEVLGLGS